MCDLFEQPIMTCRGGGQFCKYHFISRLHYIFVLFPKFPTFVLYFSWNYSPVLLSYFLHRDFYSNTLSSHPLNHQNFPWPFSKMSVAQHLRVCLGRGSKKEHCLYVCENVDTYGRPQIFLTIFASYPVPHSMKFLVFVNTISAVLSLL